MSLLRIALAAAVALAPVRSGAETIYIYRNVKPDPAANAATGSGGGGATTPAGGTQAQPGLSYQSSSGASGRSVNMVPTVGGMTGATSFALTSGSLPGGLSLNAATGAITGVVRAPASGLRVTVTDAAGKSAVSNAFSIQATNVTALSYQSAANVGRVGVPLTIPSPLTSGLSATPGFRVSAGSLPAGLTLDAASGSISGTPTLAGGLPAVTVSATAADGSTVNSNALSFTIGQPSVAYKDAKGTIGKALTLSPTTAFLNSPQFEVTGGTLPDGLTLSPGSGTIAGTPTAAGNAQITVHAYDSGAAQAYSPPFNLSIASGTITVTPSPVSAKEGDFVSFNATTTLANPTWTFAGNPSWLNVYQSGTTLYGTGTAPTVASAQTYSVDVTATSGSQSVTETVPVSVGLAKTSFTTLAAARVGSPFNFAIGVKQTTDAGGGGWIAYSEPQNLTPKNLTSLSVRDGVLTGSFPIDATTSSQWLVTVAYGGVAASTTLRLYNKFTANVVGSLQVNTGVDFRVPAPTIPVNSLIGKATWFAQTALPDGVSLDPTTGQFHGRTDVPGSYPINLVAVDSFDNASYAATQTLVIQSTQGLLTASQDFPPSAAPYTYGVTWALSTQPISTYDSSYGFTLTNTGKGTTTGIKLSVEPDASDPGVIGVRNPTCPDLATSATCRVVVFFKPTSDGAKSAYVTATWDGAATPVRFRVTGTSQGIQYAGRIVVNASADIQTIQLPVKKTTTVRYMVVAPGYDSPTTGIQLHYGVSAGQVITGQQVTDSQGRLTAKIGLVSGATSVLGNATAGNSGTRYSGGGGRLTSAAPGLLQGMDGGTNGGKGGGAYNAAAGGSIYVQNENGQAVSTGPTVFKLVTITAGAGGKGGGPGRECAAGGYNLHTGSGGGGGILIDGVGPKASDGTNSGYQGQGGTGYGAGGGGGTYSPYTAQCGVSSSGGGKGAPGVAYLEWDPS